ncbi:phage-like putative tail protein [Thermoclostridium stercorarium subsp. stercorarium DSM 8532]|uniref:Phage-like putative tail protein n=1 Tax=Thermoclostridium stercorarium (strain ATCC 35414 / DSM 8532 / NCIMB 11754) TaxID=1121335 RepID=L7VLC1_THES1|nr:hypothetical protein [Thermoclostridium stercorarium]AGC67449.1 phage-like putative tail protein [Thermoclostridium stercorarium subsp. stercorarium DSM 8532]AGI38509.1 hypothetical protein Clst_0408 [Thermoclostridium stercorarium subsp. stercorarium DSM 8532]
MPNYTENYNLKKPLPNEYYNVQDQNDNMDIIDSELKKLDRKVENIEVPVTSVNGKTGDVELTADDVGAETPAGAQAKAEAAAAAAVIAHDTAEKHIGYAVANGTNSYSVTIPGITQLAEGMSFKIKFANANTGACTLNINNLGAKNIVKGNGNALSSGNIKAGQICHLVYNGSNFQLLGEGGEYGTAQPQHVLEGYTIGTEEGIKEGTMVNQGAKIITPSTVNQAIPAGYHNGQGYVKGDSNLIASNIKKGVTIFGLSGTFTSDATAAASDILSGKTAYVNGNKVTGTMVNRGAVILTPGTTNQAIPAGYHNGQGYVKGDPNLIASNIKKGVSIFGVTGTLEYSQTASGSITIEPDVTYTTVSLSFTPKLVYGFEKTERHLFIYSSTKSLFWAENSYGEYLYGIEFLLSDNDMRFYPYSNIITNGFHIILSAYSLSKPHIVEWFAVG